MNNPIISMPMMQSKNYLGSSYIEDLRMRINIDKDLTLTDLQGRFIEYSLDQ